MMRLSMWGIIVGLVLMGAIGRVGAQDAIMNGPGPEGESETYVIPADAYISLVEVSYIYNICPEILFEANYDVLPDYMIPNDITGSTYYYDDIRAQKIFMSISGISLKIPPHNDCYTTVDASAYLNPAYIEQEHNICIEAFYKLIQPSEDGKNTAYLRKDALPCMNEQGQRLSYRQLSATAEYYTTSAIVITAPENKLDLEYCMEELERYNPLIKIQNNRAWEILPYLEGMRLIVVNNISRCHSVSLEGTTLYSLSQKWNVCMEAILDATGTRFSEIFYKGIVISIPQNATPCYDSTGQRLNVPRETAYIPQKGEFFIDVARKYNICMEALKEANPLSWRVDTPFLEVIFVPIDKPCEFKMTVDSSWFTLGTLATRTNVCMNRLEAANPTPSETFIIPDRPPCYRVTENNLVELVPYLCYDVPVTPDSDFTGHVPPVSASRDTNRPYCYEITERMTVVYQNVSYTIYKWRGYDTYITVGQCFGIDPEELFVLNSQNLSDDLNPYIWGKPLFVPQPHEDCWMQGADDETYLQRYRQLTYQAGSLQAGIYTVNYGDTLSSTGRKYGYPYQWIADANNIAAPYTIYYLQELKMPPYPSLYTLVPVGGGAGVIVLVSSTIYGLWRWRRSRTKGKKKNEAA